MHNLTDFADYYFDWLGGVMSEAGEQMLGESLEPSQLPGAVDDLPDTVERELARVRPYYFECRNIVGPIRKQHSRFDALELTDTSVQEAIRACLNAEQQLFALHGRIRCTALQLYQAFGAWTDSYFAAAWTHNVPDIDRYCDQWCNWSFAHADLAELETGREQRLSEFGAHLMFYSPPLQDIIEAQASGEARCYLERAAQLSER